VDSVTMRLQSTLGNFSLNEFRLQWGRDNEYQLSQPSLPGEPTTAPGGRSPQVFLTNGLSFGVPDSLDRRKFPNEDRWQVADSFLISSGRHTIKFGGDINRVTDDLDNLRFESGEFSYTGGVNGAGFYGGLNDFIIDFTNFKTPLPAGSLCYSTTRAPGKCYAGNFNQGLGVNGLLMKTTDVNLFVQDDWRISRRLTLNLGLRWEYQSNPKARNVNPALPQTANSPEDTNNYGPRVGFAYALSPDNKTSLRGGYGIYYGRMVNSTIFNALINTGVGVDKAQRQVTVTATAAASPVFPNLIASGTLVTPAVQYLASDFSNPLIHQFDLILEREILPNTVVSASYIGSAGRNLPTFVDTNLNTSTTPRTFTIADGPLGGRTMTIDVFPTARPNTSYAQITEIRSSISSSYSAFVLQFNRRMSRGLQVLTSYTHSRAEDTGQGSQTFTTSNVPFDVRRPEFEHGLSNFDTPNKFVASAIWSLNWQEDGPLQTIFNGFTFAPVFYAFNGSRYSGGLSVSGAGGAGGVNQSGGANRIPLLGRNFFQRPKIVNTDLRVSRRFKLAGSKTAEFLVEGFNIFNRTQVTNVNSTMYSMSYTTNTLTYNTPFQSISETSSTLFRERQVQMSVRFQF
jgi:hypothetical protein